MLRRQERRAAGEGVTEGGRPRPLQSPSPRLLPRSPPADSNGHRCQWSPQSPALPASWGNMEAASEIPRDPDRSPEAQRVVPPTLGTK